VEYCSSCHRVIRDSANIKWVLGRPYGSKCGIYVEQTHKLREAQRNDPSMPWQDEMDINSDENRVKEK